MVFLKVYIITGDQGAGKTTFLSTFADLLKKEGIITGGILARGKWNNDVRTGFTMEDISTGHQMQLASREKEHDWYSPGKFFFNPASISYGNSLLQSDEILKNDVIILDEVGPFELKGEIWAPGLNKLCETYTGLLIISVRKSLMQKVISFWGFTHPEIIDITEVTEAELAVRIEEFVQKKEDN